MKTEEIKIKYNCHSSALCCGDLSVEVGGIEWRFPENCLISGGDVVFNDLDDDYEIYEGEWSISRWPDDFPGNLKQPVLDAVNENIPHGCCGECA